MNCEACGSENLDGARFCTHCGAVLPGEGNDEDALIGQTIGGRFRIVRVLGEGGMGVVYEAEQQMGSTSRKVAVKTLHAHLSHDPSVSARFHRECGTVAQLEHPNTIKVYDFGATADGTLYIAMEFVRGQSLNDCISEAGTLAPDRTLKIMRQICGSLAEAHEKGIIHRDLKPENVVLTVRAGEKDVVKLLDFGIAARTESADAEKEQKLTQQGMVLGTPPYMSPEQFTGKALDARSDIYSLGVMAYEMLTGQLPFEADTPWQWATEHMTSQPRPFETSPVSSEIPSAMRSAILRSLSKDRDQRQETVTEFFKELAGESTGQQVAAVSGSTGTAAMEAAPDFAGPAGASSPGISKTADMPAPAVASAPQMPAAPARRKEGGKGLIIGLVTLGGVLLIGIVVFAAQSMRPRADENADPAALSDVSGQTTVEPDLGGEEPSGASGGSSEGAEQEEPSPGESEPAQTKKTSQTKMPSQPQAPSDPPPSQPKAPTQPKPSKPPVQKEPSGPTGAAACSACIAAASSGNIQGAASNYRRCDDSSQKKRCTQLARTPAYNAAKTAAFNNQCSQAKAIVAAGSSMGIRGLEAAVKTCP